MRLVASFCTAAHGSRSLPFPWYELNIEAHEGSFENPPNDDGQSVNVKFYIAQALTIRMLVTVLKEPCVAVSRWGTAFGLAYYTVCFSFGESSYCWMLTVVQF